MKWPDKVFQGGAGADRNPDEARLAIYDFDCGDVIWVRASELPSGLLQVQMEGLDHPVWVDPTRLQQGEYKHPPFGPEIRELFARLKDAFDEVYPRTIDEWEDGFRRDCDPGKEIAIWTHIADVYEACIEGKELSFEAKQDYLKVLLVCSSAAPRELVLQSVSLSTITEGAANQAIELYFSRPDAPPNLGVSRTLET